MIIKNYSSYSILLFLLILQFSVDIVHSIHCFECESRFDPRCLDPFSSEPFGLVDCEHYTRFPNATMCRKISYEGNIYRSCYREGQHDPSSCYRLNDINGTIVNGQSCHVCTMDRCNSAIEYVPSLFLIAYTFLIYCCTL